jgi:hypothetical protein
MRLARSLRVRLPSHNSVSAPDRVRRIHPARLGEMDVVPGALDQTSLQRAFDARKSVRAVSLIGAVILRH